ncbi:tetratricopeptide repeat protein [Desulfolutivibrio sp.]|uniref:tetratricopeptide repeat protein n=1 Tax=Desulfolutivibrio sp. TaxID=2773296 RepID=UPI002F968F04
MSDQFRVLGIYSLTKSTEVGVGGTAKGYEQKTYWFVRRLPDDTYEVQPLNANHLPSGIKRILSKGEFLAGYAPEPGYYEKKTLPHVQSLKKKLAQGEEALCAGNLDDAEKMFCKALLLDEDNPTANMALGEVYCRKQEHKRLEAVLRRILNLDEVFKEEQRHVFNSFGISLRKEKYFAEAIRYYRRAIEFNPTDENLHFNAARAYFEAGELTLCVEHLEQALRLRPEFAEAAEFLRYLKSCSAVTAASSTPAAPDGSGPPLEG